MKALYEVAAGSLTENLDYRAIPSYIHVCRVVGMSQPQQDRTLESPAVRFLSEKQDGNMDNMDKNSVIVKTKQTDNTLDTQG